ncbi:MAG TPA: Mrp/NBP35 family ATP-binding protein [Candidatus Limnocylindria bacterium]|nr:Mrp/NBP35 family ATP-binding protein [Candidatus Limnocylindria bacterium]
MPPPDVELVREALRTVLFPNFRRDLVTLGMVETVRADGETVYIRLRPGTEKPEVLQALQARVDAAVKRVPGVQRVVVECARAVEGRGRDPFAGRAALPGVRHVIAVASAKGGVGKSTVAANLAAALAATGAATGLLDADVYGPSVPLMFGTSERPRPGPDRTIEPLVRHGVRLVSMGFFLDEQSPVIWRGPIVMGIVRQFLRDVRWGTLDYLIVDLPPGTGDAALTLAQQVPLSGAVIVTTPQDVALLDVGRGIAMFRQLSTPVLGVVENMAGYACPECGAVDLVFGEGGGAALAERFGVPLLARIPLVARVREQGDAGVPVVIAAPELPVSATYRALAERLAADLERVTDTATAC